MQFWAVGSASPHQTVRFRQSVDKRWTCGQAVGSSGPAAARRRAEALEDPPREHRAARDESGEVADAVAPASSSARALSGASTPPVAMSSRRSPKRARVRRTLASVAAKDLGPGQSAAALREPAAPRRVACCRSSRCGRPRRAIAGMIVALVGVREVGRDLHDERPRRGRAHGVEQRAQLGGPLAPRVDERVFGDEMLNSTRSPCGRAGARARRNPPAIRPPRSRSAARDAAVARRSARERVEARVLEPVAVDSPGPAAVRTRTRFGSGWPGRGWRVMLFAVTAPNPRPMARRRMRGVVVLRREDERVREPHPAQRGGEPRHRRARKAESRSSGRARSTVCPSATARGFGETAQDAVVEEPIQRGDCVRHARGRGENSTAIGAISLDDAATRPIPLSIVELCALSGVLLLVTACATTTLWTWGLSATQDLRDPPSAPAVARPSAGPPSFAFGPIRSRSATRSASGIPTLRTISTRTTASCSRAASGNSSRTPASIPRRRV